ncbi:putative ABC transporter permease protein [Gordonia effusa NBRC 100432]|uniref:Putative ABC transporter permease protein n=1 Tax=Gordonia effusa NBRC 100432 TaxID=1077974 RepID=H0QX79_9ACTN|nr:iron chelate uptake ABC transporter family permease subunit [Gordonia effusa]GAB17430.1 putative ABC transporter permease protein [Gordonia effusa NBRC 100432]
MNAVLVRRIPSVLALWSVGIAILAISIAVAVTIGSSSVGARDVWQLVWSEIGFGTTDLSPIQQGIIWDLRLPRSVLAAVCGAGLALCGAVLQSLLRNPLADPFVLGVSSGASTGAVTVVVLGVGAGAIGMAGGAFVGAMAAFGLVLLLVRLTGSRAADTVILAGVAATQLFSALTSFIVYTSADPEQTRGVLFWLLGSLASAQWSQVVICAVVVGFGLLVCVLHAGNLDALTFGNDAAAALGVHVTRTRTILLLATALMTAVIVSTSGAIGFVGLVLPHIARAVVGMGHRLLLPTVALLGAVFLVWVDTAARVVIAPQELPVGVATALVGVPVFIAIFAMRGRSMGRER